MAPRGAFPFQRRCSFQTFGVTKVWQISIIGLSSSPMCDLPMTLAIPVGYPEQLGTLASALNQNLAKLVPDMAEEERGAMAMRLTEQCRDVLGGLRVPMLPGVPAEQLYSADRTYEMLAPVWEGVLWVTFPEQPEEWRRDALARLLESLRCTVGGFVVLRGRALLQNRNAQMFKAFQGDYVAVASAFGVCAERARQIIAEQAAQAKARRQQEEKG